MGMAAKKNDDGGKVRDLTTRVLIQIRDGVQRTNDRLEETNARLDDLRDVAGERYRELDVRLRALETKAAGRR